MTHVTFGVTTALTFVKYYIRIELLPVILKTLY